MDEPRQISSQGKYSIPEDMLNPWKESETSRNSEMEELIERKRRKLSNDIEVSQEI